MHTAEKEQIERALETEHGIMERQELLKQLWKLNQMTEEDSDVPTDDRSSVCPSQRQNGNGVVEADRDKELDSPYEAAELLVQG